ncbi:parallel beta-helix domain-containing protein [Pyruvatibacter mobilis]|uniref:parallel beta-helix domain-containing protein n=1 Tax=Pyruvatibacter mobilis TaxID=1712261 RepID=UPI003BA874D0
MPPITDIQDTRRFLPGTTAALLAALLAAPLTATAPVAASAQDGGTGDIPAAETTEATEATETTDAYTAIQQALIMAEPGAVIELGPGRYELSDGLSLNVDDVTIKGAGMDKTILSFRGQETGAEGLLVESSGVTLMDFAVEDAKGDAIKVIGADGITFLRVRAEWTNGPDALNGAYGLYPVACKNVLIDGAVARGASDAGIYVGQSDNIIVRNSLAEYNVAGIEIENSYVADVYDNVARHNTGGILVFDLPGLPQQGGHSVRVFNNTVIDNDTPNFAPAGNIVGGVPMGTGVMVMANSKVEVFKNRIANNATTGVLIVAYPNEYEDEKYYPYPEGISVYDNSFENIGFAPDNEIGELIASISGTPVPDIVWDGNVPFWHYLAGIPENRGIYVGENAGSADNGGASFMDLDVIPFFTLSWFHSPSTDLPDHAGGVDALPGATLPAEQEEKARTL